MEPTPALAVNVASAVEPAPNNTPLMAGKKLNCGSAQQPVDHRQSKNEADSLTVSDITETGFKLPAQRFPRPWLTPSHPSQANQNRPRDDEHQHADKKTRRRHF